MLDHDGGAERQSIVIGAVKTRADLAQNGIVQLRVGSLRGRGLEGDLAVARIAPAKVIEGVQAGCQGDAAQDQQKQDG